MQADNLFDGIDSREIEARVPLREQVVMRPELIELLICQRAKRCEFAPQ
jgi:hypothetical protein